MVTSKAPATDVTTTQPSSEALRGLARIARMLERSSGDLGLAHYRILTMVAQGDERASRLATRLALGRPAVSATVDALAGKGLLTRSAVSGDLRGTSLSVTAKGREAIAEAEAAMAVELEGLLALTPDPAAVLSALSLLSAALDRRWALTHDGMDEPSGPDAPPPS
jgi:DNA-binding MarR family transcriptional regulator